MAAAIGNGVHHGKDERETIDLKYEITHKSLSYICIFEAFYERGWFLPFFNHRPRRLSGEIHYAINAAYLSGKTILVKSSFSGTSCGEL